MLLKKKPEPPKTINYSAYNKSWYFGFIEEWSIILPSKKDELGIQSQYLEELATRINANTNNKNLKLLNEKEVEKFWNGIHENLQFIDDLEILSCKKYNTSLRQFLLKIKGVDLVTSYLEDDIVVSTKTSDCVVARATKRHIFIELLSHSKKNNTLTISGCSTFPFDPETTKLVVIINGKIKELKDCGLYGDFKIFGETVYHKYQFSLSLDLKDTIPLEIKFLLKNKQEKTLAPLTLNFNTYMSKLAGQITYWRFAGYRAHHDKKALFIKQNEPLKTFLREIIYLTALTILWRRPRTAILRTLYWITKPVLQKRNIWLYSDKIYKAGDNAEWLYRYADKQNDKIHHYYTLREDSPDAKRFDDDKLPYLKYKTIWQRLLFLHADILIFTHNNAPGYYRFGGVNEAYFRGLYNYDIMYVQHGLTVQDTAWLFNRSKDDFTKFFVASKFETENLLRPGYGFGMENIAKVGATRYDGLVNDDKKKILITPTWRTYLAPPGRDYGESRDGNTKFKNTDFFKIYNNLISNEKLINSAKKYNYEIIYLLHPVMSNQLNDFDTEGYVKVLQANDDFNYQKAMTESSLMVTDYSGVQFDFAYMYKPVVYFHPPELPASYDEAVYQYDKHALGEIVKESDKLVDLLCMYMREGCRIKPLYAKRIDDFFYHHDHKNSERTYETIVDWQKSL